MKNVPVCIILDSGKMYLRTVPEAALTKDVFSPDITEEDKKRFADSLAKEYEERITSFSIDWSRMNVVEIDLL